MAEYLVYKIERRPHLFIDKIEAKAFSSQKVYEKHVWNYSPPYQYNRLFFTRRDKLIAIKGLVTRHPLSPVVFKVNNKVESKSLD